MARIIALVVPIKLSLAPIKLAIPSSTGKKGHYNGERDQLARSTVHAKLHTNYIIQSNDRIKSRAHTHRCKRVIL